MQVAFEPEEDRLLLRVNTGGRHRAEFRFWLTRRYVRILWMALLNMLKQKLAAQSSSQLAQLAQGEPSPAVVQKLKEDHLKAVESADFQTAYQESQIFPLGEQPILLAKVGLGNHPHGQIILSMEPQVGQGIEISLSNQILHSLCKLLEEGSERAGWDLALDFGQAKDLIDQIGLN